MNKRLLYRISVKGRVQGVGFRWSAAREASMLDINGFVRNQEDGSVYIEAEGSEDQLNVFLDWCRIGPRSGLVQSVDFTIVSPASYTDFRIEH
jgi:acylphosphatase